MNVFVDYHHAGLYYSLHLLFEKRFGFELFRPIGMEWFDKGFWDIAKPYNNNINTVKQFLSLQPGYQPVDGSPPLNQITRRSTDSLYHRVQDNYHGFQEKAITLQQFKDMDIDIIVASIPDHWKTYTALRDKYKPKAKVICHMGNMFNEIQPAISDGVVKNLLSSTIEFPVKDINAVFYHQEQPLREFFPTPENKFGHISSFVHLLPRIDLFTQYKNLLPQFNFRAFGQGAIDGCCESLSQVYDLMQESSFIWQVKPGGDGYGWNWHSAFINGRPIITNFSDYKDKLGGLLFEDGVTGINIENKNPVQTAERLKNIVVTGKLQEMQKNCYERFRNVVNFDGERDSIAGFLENLKN